MHIFWFRPYTLITHFYNAFISYECEPPDTSIILELHMCGVGVSCKDGPTAAPCPSTVSLAEDGLRVTHTYNVSACTQVYLHEHMCWEGDGNISRFAEQCRVYAAHEWALHEF